MDGVILNITVFDLVMVMLCSDYSFTALRRLIATLNIIICVGKDKRSQSQNKTGRNKSLSVRFCETRQFLCYFIFTSVAQSVFFVINDKIRCWL